MSTVFDISLERGILPKFPFYEWVICMLLLVSIVQPRVIKELRNIRPLVLIFSQAQLDEVDAVLRAILEDLFFELRLFV